MKDKQVAIKNTLKNLNLVFLRIDSDNQDNPKDIINLLNKFDGSQDMILTHRMRRKHDSFLIIQGKLYSFYQALLLELR